MKKVLCMLWVILILLVGSSIVLADPHGEPDTGSSTQVVIFG